MGPEQPWLLSLSVLRMQSHGHPCAFQPFLTVVFSHQQLCGMREHLPGRVQACLFLTIKVVVVGGDRGGFPKLSAL